METDNEDSLEDMLRDAATELEHAGLPALASAVDSARLILAAVPPQLPLFDGRT